MSHRSFFMTGMVLVAAMSVASVALAQSEKGRGRGGFGGFGGPGGMRGSSALLLSIPEVQKELGINEAQQKQLDEVIREVQAGMRGGFERRNAKDQGGDEDRKKRQEEARAKAEETTKKAEEKLGKILDAKQMERLNQLRLQREGAGSLGRPEIAKQLGLSEDQEKKIREIQEASRPGPGAFGGPNSPEGDPQDFFKKIRERREKAEADVLAVLTDAQKAKWSQMKGKEFKFPENEGRFGGGFGPGGGSGNEEKKRPERKKEKEKEKDKDKDK